MDQSFALDVLKNTPNDLSPAGCCETIVGHPLASKRDRAAIEVGFVIEHRFTFYYWIKCKQALLRGRPDSEFCPPDLVTWDWHDDFGCPSDYDEALLKRLNQADETEVAYFCWAGLRTLNDGHIAPAVWLNALGNVYILQKQLDEYECENESLDFEDRYGISHRVRYFQTPQELAKDFAQTNSGTGVIWDLDMDFFTGEEIPDQEYSLPVSADEIRGLLARENEWMPMILSDLKAVTIALEPRYTGGLGISLDLYKVWESSLFSAPLFTKECEWKDGLLPE